MGGEKLKTFRFVLLAVFAAASISIIIFPAFAQSEDEVVFPAAESVDDVSGVAISEESILLGDDPLPAVETGGASAWIALRMVLILALAALAIYGVVFFIKRLSRPPQARDPNLKVLASTPLGGDTFAAVVSVGAKAWLVGGGNGAGVSLISEITDPEALETMLLDDARKNAEFRMKGILDFRTLLNRFGNKTSAPGGTESGPLPLTEALRKQRERLKGL